MFLGFPPRHARALLVAAASLTACTTAHREVARSPSPEKPAAVAPKQEGILIHLGPGDTPGLAYTAVREGSGEFTIVEDGAGRRESSSLQYRQAQEKRIEVLAAAHGDATRLRVEFSRFEEELIVDGVPKKGPSVLAGKTYRLTRGSSGWDVTREGGGPVSIEEKKLVVGDMLEGQGVGHAEAFVGDVARFPDHVVHVGDELDGYARYLARQLGGAKDAHAKLARVETLEGEPVAAISVSCETTMHPGGVTENWTLRGEVLVRARDGRELAIRAEGPANMDDTMTKGNARVHLHGSGTMRIDMREKIDAEGNSP
jgi:hypothetical protein